jgi:nicotinate phosphoribosyltransferase
VAREGADGELVSVAKKSLDKVSIGGRKYALRRRGPSGVAQAEVVGIGEAPADDGNDRPLLVPLVEGGKVVGRATLEEARARHRASVAELPRAVTMMSAGEPVIPTVFAQ